MTALRVCGLLNERICITVYAVYKSKHGVTYLDGSGRDNTNVQWNMSGVTKNNHEHAAIDRVASDIRTPPSTRLGRYHYANLLGEMTFVIS
jgi:hypothetical protein